MNFQTSDSPSALVVDDNSAIRLAVIHILEKAGFQVMDAENGDAAFDLLKICNPDTILLFTDVEMPGELDGFALARKVAVCWPHISIVVASGNVVPGPNCMPDKACFIAKPFSAELVRAHLQEILPDGQKPEPLKRGKRAA